MPMPGDPNSSAQPLFGSKKSRDGPAPSYSVDSPSAAPLSKKMRMNEIEIQKAEASETLVKRDKDWEKLCAEYNPDTTTKAKASGTSNSGEVRAGGQSYDAGDTPITIQKLR